MALVQVFLGLSYLFTRRLSARAIIAVTKWESIVLFARSPVRAVIQVMPCFAALNSSAMLAVHGITVHSYRLALRRTLKKICCR